MGQLSEADAAGFRADFGISRAALDRLIATAYRMMGLISFFTVGSDEVKAWTVERRHRRHPGGRGHPLRHRARLHPGRGRFL